MLLKKCLLLIFGLLMFRATLLQGQDIPTPKEHFGFSIGEDYQLATYTQTEAYFKKLAASSNRTKLVDIGKTEEGRSQYMLIVSSPENLKNLDRYQKISQQLAHAENLTDEQAHALAASGKAVVWIDGGLHATETVGAHQLIETAYELTSRKDPETMRILDNVIVLLMHANPDGQELVSNWYMRDSVPSKRSLEHLPRLYEKYAGHDNNRDFFMLNLKETQNLGRQLFIEWIPQIMYNHHQAGPAGSILAGPPYRDPFNYVFDPLIITSIDAVGAAMSNRLNIENKPGYTERSGSSFSTWYNGGLRTTTYFHNMIGLLTEIVGSPTPSSIPLVPERLIPSGATPNPVTPQKWYFHQSIEYSLSLNYAVLDYAVRYRDELLYNIYRMGKNSIERGQHDNWSLSPKKIAAINQLYKDTPKNKRGASADSVNEFGESNGLPVRFYDSVMKDPALRDPRGYILPSDQPDFATAIRFLNALISTGILVQKASAPFTVAGKHYPAGSFIVKTDQAFRPHVLDMFEPQDHPNDFQYPGGPPVPPYDAAGWTLAYQMGVQFDRMLDSFDGPFERIPYGELIKQKGTLPEASSSKGYLLDARANESFTAANDLLKLGIAVFRTSGAVDGVSTGSFYVPSSQKAKAAIRQEAESIGIRVINTDKKPSLLNDIHPFRIGLFDEYGGSMASGWVRYILEKYHFAAEVIYPKDIDKGNLHDKFDVLLFVDGGIPPVLEPGEKQPRQRAEPPEESIPEIYRNRLGHISIEKSIPELEKFLKAGGNIVTIGQAARLAYQLGLPVQDALVEMVNGKEKKLPGEKYYIPGSVLRVHIDSTNAAGWGMYQNADVYFDQSPVFNIKPEAYANGSIKPLAWFTTTKPLRSGWAWGQAYLQNGVTAFSASVGKGQLIVFGPEITFRAQTQGTFKLLFNQLYQLSR